MFLHGVWLYHAHEPHARITLQTLHVFHTHAREWNWQMSDPHTYNLLFPALASSRRRSSATRSKIWSSTKKSGRKSLLPGTQAYLSRLEKPDSRRKTSSTRKLPVNDFASLVKMRWAASAMISGDLLGGEGKDELTEPGVSLPPEPLHFLPRKRAFCSWKTQGKWDEQGGRRKDIYRCLSNRSLVFSMRFRAAVLMMVKGQRALTAIPAARNSPAIPRTERDMPYLAMV